MNAAHSTHCLHGLSFRKTLVALRCAAALRRAAKIMGLHSLQHRQGGLYNILDAIREFPKPGARIQTPKWYGSYCKDTHKKGPQFTETAISDRRLCYPTEIHLTEHPALFLGPYPCHATWSKTSIIYLPESPKWA